MIGSVLNVTLRAATLALIGEVLRAGRDDHRFRQKGIGSRAIAVGVPSSLLIPVLWLRRPPGERGPYPAAMDNVYLSIYALDLAGNVLDLYDGYRHFDLIPHAHGSGAATVVTAWLFRLPMLSAIGVVQVGHILLEAQEYASDVYLGTRNVRGTWDVVGDLMAGVVGSVAYAALYQRFVRDAGREPPRPLDPSRPAAVASPQP